MNIAIVGAGRIGSAFAYQLVRRGHHDVTVVARGDWLAELRHAGAIEKVSGERAAVTVSDALDPTVPWDGILVTVLAHQVDDILPALAASAAKSVVFMFNTFDKLDHLRDAVGAHRFVFAFPMIIADFEGAKLRSTVDGVGNVTPVSEPAWAEIFRLAGIPAVLEADTESWLRAHVALMVPLMASGRIAHARNGGLTWDEARRHAIAMDEGFRIVRELGHPIIPGPVAALAAMPVPMKAALLWSSSRVPVVRKLGAKGPAEPRALVDAMLAVAPCPADALRSIRP